MMIKMVHSIGNLGEYNSLEVTKDFTYSMTSRELNLILK